MRPIANFTLHAILAAALAALAATSAAAGKSDAWIDFGNIQGESDAQKDTRDQHIELLSYSFGASRVSKVDGFTVKQGAKPYQPTLDRTFVKSWSTSGDAGSPPPYRGGVTVASGDVNDAPVGANERLTVGAGRTENASGQATGKRMHKPLRARMIYDEGSVTLSGRFPACRVGATYPSATVGQGDERYEMQGVTVAACSPGAMSLNFKKVTVRGWDPEKKEL